MEVYNRYPARQPFRWFAAPAGIALMALLAPSSVVADYTPEQRAACEDEAKFLCSNYIPDEGAVTACMKQNRKHLSPRRRAMFDKDSKQRPQQPSGK